MDRGIHLPNKQEEAKNVPEAQPQHPRSSYPVHSYTPSTRKHKLRFSKLREPHYAGSSSLIGPSQAQPRKGDRDEHESTSYIDCTVPTFPLSIKCLSSTSMLYPAHPATGHYFFPLVYFPIDLPHAIMYVLHWTKPYPAPPTSHGLRFLAGSTYIIPPFAPGLDNGHQLGILADYFRQHLDGSSSCGLYFRGR